MKPLAKLSQLTLAVLATALLLAGCSKAPAASSYESYSVTPVAVENSPFPTSQFDLSLIANQGLLITDFCWLDQNTILCLAAQPAEAEAGGENNLPQTISIYLLYTDDATFDLIYQGQHNLGKLQKLNNNQVAIVSPYSICYFNYSTHQMENEIMLEDVEDSSDNLASAPNGRYFAYSDGAGSILLSDNNGQLIATLDPKDIGYNWLSNPIWSRDSKYAAFFCGYEPYSYDNIALVAVNNPADLLKLDFEKEADVFPAWPNVGNNLLIQKNFFNNPDNLPREIQLINPASGAAGNKLKVDYYQGFTTLVYADTASNCYFFISDAKLYRQTGDQAPDLASPGPTPVYPDTVAFADNAAKAAVLDKNEATNTVTLYVMDLSQK